MKTRFPPLLAALLVGFAVVASAAPAHGHAFEPALLELSEREDGSYDVLWKVSTSSGETGRAPSEVLAPVLPGDCARVEQRRTVHMSGRQVSRWIVDCGANGLAGESLEVAGIESGGNDVLVRYRSTYQARQTAVLNAQNSAVSLAESGSADEGGWSVASSYFELGVEHILLGFDHLLFVLGLLLLVRGRRTLVATITAFTAAHSITLALSTLGVVSLSPQAVEAAIAASLLLLAVEVVQVQRGEPGLTSRAPWGVAFGFGLLHGFGFAGALGDIGLPPGDIPLALATFNIGVEIGQLGFVAAWVAAGALWEHCERQRPEWIPRAAAYVIGVPAAYWMVERIAVILRM